MEFFEFFFSGPGWGWKAFVLIWLTNVIFNGIASVIKAIFEGKTQRILAELKEITLNDDEESTKATKDDFR